MLPLLGECVLLGLAGGLALAGLGRPALAVLLLAAIAEVVVSRTISSGSRAEEVIAQGMGRALRAALRSLIAVGAGAAVFSDAVVALVAVVAVGIVGVLACVDAVDWAVAGLRRLPVARGIDGMAVPDVGAPGPAVLLAPLPEVLLLGVATAGADSVAAVSAAGLAALAIAGATGGRWLVRARAARNTGPARLKAAQAALDRDRPEAVLYYGDAASTVHEVATWLPTLDALPQTTWVLVRNRQAFDALPATASTVLCVPSAKDLLSLRLDAVRVGLFVSNIGNNIHLLRHPGLRTAFIGHGDSDKSASANPFSKVYDQIWVAGPAGRERYARAAVGVRPEALVEVGRPQLDQVSPATDVRPPVPTLMYAPTWEGWNRAQDYTSLAVLGEQIVRAVLAHPTPIRLLYRPHPYTGRRDPRVAAAHRHVVRLLAEANAAAGHAVAAELVRAPVTSIGVLSAAERERRAVAEGLHALEARPAGAHVVVPPGSAPLVSCFNAADGLITDVSSVLSDFLARDKPLAVCDPLGRGPDFSAEFPTSRAGLLLAPGDTGRLDDLLGMVTGDRADETAAARARARADVLGADTDPAAVRFGRAVSALAAQHGPGAVDRRRNSAGGQ